MSGRLLLAILGTVAILQCGLCSGADALSSTNGQFNFSFDQIEVRTFAKIVGDLTGKRMVVDQNVDGRITTVFPKIPASDIFPVFVSVLESAGCSVVQEQDGLYRIISMGARPSTSAPVIGPDEKIPEQGVYTKIFRLQYANAAELRKLLESKVRQGKEGAIGAIETTNYLIVTDTAESLRRIEKIVSEVDKQAQARITEIVALKFASADDVATQLNRAMATGADDQRRWARTMGRGFRPEGSGDGARTDGSSSLDAGRPAVIVPSPHSNSLVLVGTPEQVAELKRIIALMDVDTPSGRGRFGAIFLKYIAADEAAKTLNTLLTKRTATIATAGITGGGRDSTGGGSTISIEPHPANNALIVDAMPRDFELVKQLVLDLDTMPQQVLIEIVIAEVSAKDEDAFGVDMVAVGSPSSVGEDLLVGGLTTRQDANALMSAIQTGLFPNGITVGLAKGMRGATDGSVSAAYPLMLNLNAIEQKGKFNILSRIPLLAQNNKDAMASIVNNIPMLKSTVQGAAANLQVIQNIDRVDVGIKLKLTPHINPGGEVMMTLNPTIEAIIDPGSLANNLAPTIAHREVSTTVTVPDGRTLVLSGLMRQDRTSTVRQVPFLGSIPILGWLFRRTTDGVEKTNLIILVTPHVIKDVETAEKWTSEWKTRTGNDATNSLSGVKLDK
ncbi:MAG: type II secretion system secretin GspD [bacterium]